MTTQQPTQVGRYLVRERIGQGGMGVLYLAVDPLIDRLVAIKLLRVQDEDLHERFVREARSAGRLAHPNIVTIFDVGEHDGQPFIAMEYIAGETFGELIRRRAPLLWARKVQLVGELCDGLAYAHRAGIVHRDIKPSNIMLSRDGALKIVDFGIARIVDAGMTQTGAFIGTPNYMSPEQLDGHNVDHRSDIFSVGLVLYELFALKQAFAGDSVLAVAQKILAHEPEPLLQLDPSLDPSLVAVVERALKKDPGARYPDAAAMRADLLAVIHRANADTVIVRPAGRTPSPNSRQTADRAMLAKRRATQIESHLRTARAALAEHSYEAAIEACEHAAMLDPDEARAHEIIAEARIAIDDRQVRAWLNQAREEIGRGALAAATQLVVRILALRPSAAEALSLQREILATLREQEQTAQRQRQIQSGLDHARNFLKAGAPELAIRAANEVLALDATHREGGEIRAQATALVARHQQEQRDRRSREAIDAARLRFQAGERDAAIDALRQFDSPDDAVISALADLRNEADAIAAQAQQEARRKHEVEREREKAERARAEEQRQREAAAREVERRQEHLRQEEENRRQEAQRLHREAEDRRQEAQRLNQEAERRRSEEERLAQEQEVRRRGESERPRLDDRQTRLKPADVLHKAANAEIAQAGTPESRPFEPDVGRDLAREAGAAQPRAPWRPRRAHAIVGGGALAAATLAAVVLLWDAAPAPDSSPPRAAPSESPMSAPVELPSSVGSPAAASKEAALPPTATQTITTPLGQGTLVLDALPWAEVVEIVDAAGRRQTLPPNATTPIVLDLPPGDYDITLKNGPSRSVKARVDAGGTTRPAPVDFGQIDAAEYFRKLK